MEFKENPIIYKLKEQNGNLIDLVNKMDVKIGVLEKYIRENIEDGGDENIKNIVILTQSSDDSENYKENSLPSDV